MIQVENLFKRFGTFEALKHVSFEVEKGESVGLLGENGAGKTTTMRILSCYIPPTRGLVRVAGHEAVLESEAVRRSIGYMPESVPIYGSMRVEEYVRFRAKLKGVASRDARAATARALALVNLTDRRRSLVQTLSKGLRQRVGLADALVHDPAVLILDEPTSGLDPSQRQEVRQLIGGLEQEHTVLLSTHILPEVEATCSRVVVINQGRVVAKETIADLKRYGQKDRFDVVCRADEAGARAALEGVDAVTVSEVTSSKDGRISLRVETDDVERGRPRAVAALAARGIDIHEVVSAQASLEEAFLRLIGKGPEEAEA